MTIDRKTMLLLAIFAIASVTRFYRLDSIPPGPNTDEALFANTAYCLLTTGRDLEGNFLPLVSHGRHFITLLPMQVYLNVLPVFIFGFNEFAVRFMPALLGVLIVMMSFMLGRLLFNDSVGLLTAFLVAVAPWHVTYSRIGFANLLPTTFLFLLGLYLLLDGLHGDRRRMLAGAVALGLTFFSYYLADVYVPLFLFGLYYILYDRLKSAGGVGFYYLSVALVGLFLLASLLIGYSEATAMNKPASSLSELWGNLVEELDVILLRGWWAWPALPDGVGVIYPFYVPFLLLGVVLLLLRRDYAGFLLVFWFSLSLVLGALSSGVGGGSLHRIFTFAGPVFEMIVAYSLYRIFVFYGRSKRVLFLLTGVFSVCLLLEAGGFLFYYFVSQPRLAVNERVFEFPLRELFGYTESVKDGYDAVVFDEVFKSRLCLSNESIDGLEVYVVCRLGFEDYLMFYTKRCPVDSKYTFGDLSSHPLDGRNLFVTNDMAIANKSPVKTISYSDGEVVYALFA